ncbi:C4-dicarboxylate transporter/malic acid transport protein [Magnetococcus marinus MC-1]|uniref:C4-dicarboxylate transporter/malic acid transport protein n=1 Tax=Magnetococcus marinus (strain ATCC BAA-1437 / JCM 17883 / MC-1) TaxID=156889 RepID=A0LC46_MAGMM|nr:SLAC1 anion channel family protein [Magnetococcus marinus]ABK45539.1 C4-dicarboxylate transporter/malic acid transport protein [Magnetococcus marinus MC-1]
MISPPRLPFLPISIFATVMGLAGLSIAWTKAEPLLKLATLSPLLMGLTGTLFVVLLLLYVVKVVRHPEAVRAELHHPIKLSFFPTISISLLLLSIVTLHLMPHLSKGLWLLGAGLHLGLTLYVLSAWLNHDHFEIKHMNPSWFIPVVGNIVIPLAGVEHGYLEPSWFFFSIGLLFWLVLMVIVFYRLFFHPPLPDKLMPTLFILIAPPAVGFLAYLKLTGELDAFARILYYAGLFLTLMLFTQIRRFTRLKFFLSWWAYSFPLAAITVATLVMQQRLNTLFYLWLSMLLMGILCLVILGLAVRTGLAVYRREICVEE